MEQQPQRRSTTKQWQTYYTTGIDIEKKIWNNCDLYEIFRKNIHARRLQWKSFLWDTLPCCCRLVLCFSPIFWFFLFFYCSCCSVLCICYAMHNKVNINVLVVKESPSPFTYQNRISRHWDNLHGVDINFYIVIVSRDSFKPRICKSFWFYTNEGFIN